MRVLPDLAVRVREPELMDGYGLDKTLHEDALDALARVNRVSLTAARAWREVERLARAGVSPVRVLDVACGGGDVLIAMARKARRRGMAIELCGCDVSAVALERARRLADPVQVDFRLLDVLHEPLPSGQDVVLCSLFLHHFSRTGAIGLLSSLAAATERVLLVQDLRRTRLGYGLAWLGLHTLTGSVVARIDGLVSVRAAFTLDEAAGLAREAGLAGADISPCWPQRFTLRWTR